MKNFALIGAAGFIAPKHFKAIKETGNKLVVAMDVNDSVGLIDSYFPESDFFKEFERFDRHIEKLRRENNGSNKIDYISICSPNYFHDSHIRFALRAGAHAICEKPLVLNPWNIDSLVQSEEEFRKRIFTVLQLRLHPSIIKFKKEILSKSDKKFDIDLTYITSRGKWYDYSWKGDLSKSGGIATNIGVHFFDMLYDIFGKVIINEVHFKNERKSGGYLEFERANVRWFLSIDDTDLPIDQARMGLRTYRSLKCNGQEVEFSSGFENLHTAVYEDILAGNGYGPIDAKPSIEIVHKIRNSSAIYKTDMAHPLTPR